LQHLSFLHFLSLVNFFMPTLALLDIIVLAVVLLLVMSTGFWGGKKEQTAGDFFLAGQSVKWWGIAGAIFGANISANHLVGMMGAAYGIGFAQANYEIISVVGILALCYVFIPVYRSIQIYTISEYLERRFSTRCRLAYSLLTIALTFIFLFFTIYFGARSLAVLLDGTMLPLTYGQIVVVFAVVTAAYTVIGGMHAVIWADLILSVLIVIAGVVVAVLVFSQPEISGFSGLLALDAAQPRDRQMLHLFLPSDHPKLPWTGIVTGLLLLNISFFGTNQYITQRVLAARSDTDARKGAITAAFLKLFLVFFTILPGVAAYYLFKERNLSVLPDDVFPTLVRTLVPAGYGIIGLIVCGLVGAILSTMDALLNAGATLYTFDVYKRGLRPAATDRQLVRQGRVATLTLLIAASAFAVFALNPDDPQEGFLKIASATGYFVPGVIITFLFGLFWRRSTSTAALATLTLSPLIALVLPGAYGRLASSLPLLAEWFGRDLNFLHRIGATCTIAALLMAALSLMTSHLRDDAREAFVFSTMAANRTEGARPTFWKSDRPWAIGLAVCAIAIVIYFA
jgi:solute:Na+ symporter, SSS family